MNQNNCHRLTWDIGPDQQQVLDALEEYTGFSIPAIQEILEGEAQDWPYRQVNMARLSREWPETVFALDILGPQEEQQAREYYRNGHMHTVFSINAFPELNPGDLKPLPMFAGSGQTSKLHTTPMPEGRLRCDGAECGFTGLENVHFTDGRDHEDQPEDLYYAELIDQEYQMECSGFFCSWCLEAAGLTPEGRTTLLEEMEWRQNAEPRTQQPQTNEQQGGCSWKPCSHDPQMRVFHPSPEHVWMTLGDYCGFHFGVMALEGKAPRNWRASDLNSLPEGEMKAGELP